MVKLKRIIVCSVLACGIALGEIDLPNIFGDNMVLQRNTTVNIWGTAAPNARVSVSGSCMVYPVGAQANSKGEWKTAFKTVDAGRGYSLTVKDNSDSQVEFTNILCGEVWLCSGQSNMQWDMNRIDNSEAEIAAADYPDIRLFGVPLVSSPDKQTDVDASWQICSPETVRGFSSVAYFFGRELNQELDIPIGLIRSSWGGSKIEAWIPTEGYEGLSRLGGLKEEIERKTPGSKAYEQSVKDAIKKVSEWQKKAAESIKSGKSVDDLPAVSFNLPQRQSGIQGLYNAMIHPLVPFTIKGAIWYQGESNRNDGMMYYEKKKALIGGWRSIWQQGDFPFYYAHLAPYNYGEEESLPLVWEAQLYCLNIPNTGMAVTNDIGNFEDIHPQNKQDVGKRLALWALAKDYGRDQIVYSGPIYKSVNFEGDKAVVGFSHYGSGLTTRDGKSPDWFELAGSDGVFHKAQAKIVSADSVEAWADNVKEPKIVRLGWDKSATPNLMNKEGLPTPAFSSDIDKRILPEGNNYALNKPYVSSDENRHSDSWKQGLTNGNWATDSLNCFASNNSPSFPKYATIDLQKSETISRVYFGVPNYGSTKTVQIEISTDGENFKPVGKHEFAFKTVENVLIDFEPQQARYVRVAFLENYQEAAGYDKNFVFMTEVEVY